MLTATVSLSNFCMNSCKYCVSGSGSKRWNPPSDWSKVPADDLLDVAKLDTWLSTFAPTCRIHLSGGEPLCRPDIEDAVELLSRRHSITIYTNGQLISQRPRLLDLSLDWLVTWHSSQVSLGAFVRQVELLRDRPVVARTVLSRSEDKENLEALGKALPWVRHTHAAWNRAARKSFPDFRPDPGDIDHIASRTIHLIVPWGGGAVFCCNSAVEKHKIGSVVEGWYRPERAAEQDIRARDCVSNNRCAAYADAVMVPRWLGETTDKPVERPNFKGEI